MVFGVSIVVINTILYCMQQLGVALGLGAQTVMLVAYVSAMRDGVIDEEESQFLRATRNVLWVALAFIVLSGIAITFIHFVGTYNQDSSIALYNKSTLFSAAYLFKLALIAGVIIFTALLHVIPETFAEGLLGGTWYALFLVHILAPITSWTNLLTLYAVWLVGFNLVWYVVVYAKKERIDKPVVKSSEAMILQKSAKPAPAAPEIKKERKSFFSFFAKKPKPEVAAVQEPVITPDPIPTQVPTLVPPPVVTPAALPQIKLDPVPKTPPVVMPATLHMGETKISDTPASAQSPAPVAPPKPAPAPAPVEKMPGSIATDTPFLPQVPPLQPIPIIIPTSPTPMPTAVPAAGIPKAIGDAPLLQKPEALLVTPASPSALTTAPEIKLGLNVMPKSPDQLK